jgi:hypothetical protein
MPKKRSYLPATTVIDITGERFGRLVAQRYVGDGKWECVCEPKHGGCGTKAVVGGSQLRIGRTRSCGCLRHNSPLNKNKGRRRRQSTRRVVVVDYWNKAGDHRPYQSQLHDRADEPIDVLRVIEALVAEAGIVDGDEVVITMKATGKRPFGNRKMRWDRPHRYEREAKKGKQQ